ncbi:hypothetical protein FOA52_005298 [Chlamydomonas sp. UWO 241]|nr:hypothetical protein FOA52_005298 [Chlamydomonas sp. UWO 241]
MGVLLSLFYRGQTSFLTYEKSLERIQAESSKLLARRHKRRNTLNGYKNTLQGLGIVTLAPCIAWVAWLRQSTAAYTVAGYFMRTTLPFLAPLLAFALAFALGWLLWLAERREDSSIKKLEGSKKKLIKELKDSTNFEKTMALLKKYDPEQQVALRAQTQSELRAGGGRGQPVGGVPPPPPPAGQKGAARVLLGAFDSLAAKCGMGNDPRMFDELRRVQTAAVALKAENDALRSALNAVCARHDEAPPCVPSFVAMEGPPQQVGGGGAADDGGAQMAQRHASYLGDGDSAPAAASASSAQPPGGAADDAASGGAGGDGGDGPHGPGVSAGEEGSGDDANAGGAADAGAAAQGKATCEVEASVKPRAAGAGGGKGAAAQTLTKRKGGARA